MVLHRFIEVVEGTAAAAAATAVPSCWITRGRMMIWSHEKNHEVCLQLFFQLSASWNTFVDKHGWKGARLCKWAVRFISWRTCTSMSLSWITRCLHRLWGKWVKDDLCASLIFPTPPCITFYPPLRGGRGILLNYHIVASTGTETPACHSVGLIPGCPR